MGRIIVTALFLLGLHVSVARAQLATADLEVLGVKGGVVDKTYVCEVFIRNFNDDGAADVGLIVLLPNEVTVRSVPPECTPAAPVGSNWNGFVTCKLGDLPPEQTCKANRERGFPEAECERRSRRSVTVKTSLPPAQGASGCAAFVWSRTGDHNKKSNFMTGP
jgi:hypothetical protein